MRFLIALATFALSGVNQAAVPLLNEGQKAYLALPRAERVRRFADKGERLKLKALGDKPQKVWVDWEGTPTATWTFALRLGDRVVERQSVTTNAVCLNNLEIARTYSWTATDGTVTQSGTFATEDVAPRLIDIPGVPNVRDFGGRIGRGGRRVRQSRVYRSAGLNNNATPEFWKPEELRAQDADGSFARLERKLRDDLAYWTAAATNPPPMHFVDARISDAWTVATNGDVAVYTQTVESPADGWITVGCGGEWFWRIRVNGETAFDLMTAGNVKAPVGPDNHLVPLRLRKGANEIRVESKGGDASWTFAAANRPEASLAQIAASKKLEAEKRLDREVLHKYRRWKPGTPRLTDETRAYMLDVLGIRSDIDLRSGPETSGMTGSPLGPSVTWFHYPAQMYANLGSAIGRQQFGKVFRVFLDERNYPIDFHCIAGQDRTGAVAFILNGLLGVDEEELYKDWEATCFWNKNVSLRHEKSFNKLVQVFDAYEGATINDRIEKYVLACGFTPEEIAHFRDLMLEPPTSSVDFGQVAGRLRPELHSSGFGPMLVGKGFGGPHGLDDLKALNLYAARTHDWALINNGQRCCDTHFIFPLMHLDADDPKNYFFKPTDELVRRTVDLGMKIYFRMGTSIEHTGEFMCNAVAVEDAEKYAEVLAHIVRHYNAGWANGFHYGIKYWEIWNEPDGLDNLWRWPGPEGRDVIRMRQRFTRFFIAVYKRLKSEFPECKFGGPGLCSLNPKYMRPFLEDCKAAGVEPDFIAWHYYYHDPEDLIVTPAKGRRICDDLGLAKTEIFIDEWHYLPYPGAWSDFGGSPAQRAKVFDGPSGIRNIDAAAFLLTVSCGFQSEPIDGSYYYGCGSGSWGYVNPDGSLNKTYYGLKMFGDAIAACGTFAKADNRRAGLRAFGAMGKDGREMRLLVSSYRDAVRSVSVAVKGVPVSAVPEVRILDHADNLVPGRFEWRDGVLTLFKNDANSACWQVVFR